jgi:hypothetical protein
VKRRLSFGEAGFFWRRRQGCWHPIRPDDGVLGARPDSQAGFQALQGWIQGMLP